MIRNAIQTPRNDLQHHQLNFELDTIFPPDCTAAEPSCDFAVAAAMLRRRGGGASAACNLHASVPTVVDFEGAEVIQCRFLPMIVDDFM